MVVEVRTTSSGDPVLRRIYRVGEGTVRMVVCLRGQAEGWVLVGSTERLGKAEPECLGQ